MGELIHLHSYIWTNKSTQYVIQYGIQYGIIYSIIYIIIYSVIYVITHNMLYVHNVYIVHNRAHKKKVKGGCIPIYDTNPFLLF